MTTYILIGFACLVLGLIGGVALVVWIDKEGCRLGR